MGDRTSQIHRLYLITNTANQKNYVGQTSSHFLSSRWGKHTGCARRMVDTYLYRAMRKHGIERFSIEEIARCHDKQELVRLEKFWIGLLNANKKEFGYNQTFGGEAPKHTEETKRKISEVQKGRILSEERKIRQRQILSDPEIVEKRIAALKAWWVEARKTNNHPFFRRGAMTITPDGRKAMGDATRRRWVKYREERKTT